MAIQPPFWQALALLRGDRSNHQLACAALDQEPSTEDRHVAALANHFCRIINGRVPRVSVVTAQQLASGLGFSKMSAFFLSFEEAQLAAQNLAGKATQALPLHRSASRLRELRVQSDTNDGKHSGRKSEAKGQGHFAREIASLGRAIEQDRNASTESAKRAVEKSRKRTRLVRAESLLKRGTKAKTGRGSP